MNLKLKQSKRLVSIVYHIKGDNLSAHLSFEVIKMCEENNIVFCFLPDNSTHILQPLDVAFFHPLKVAWRYILQKWKRGTGRKKSTVPIHHM